MSTDPINCVRECRDTGEVYAAAYGYLQGALDLYINGTSSFAVLADHYGRLQMSVSTELERIMERHNKRTAELKAELADITVTSDPEVAERILQADPMTIILDAR